MKISGQTKLYGIVADPIHQIRTPELINPIFEHMGQDILSVPFHVIAADLPIAWQGFHIMKSLAGIGVAVPHKEPASLLCDQLGPSAGLVGAVAAVRRDEDGAMFGDTFEGQAFLQALEADGHAARDRKVLLLGAGGAAAAIAFALADQGAETIVIANRTRERSEKLAARVNEHTGRKLVATGPSEPAGFDIVINATVLGLRETDPMPLNTDQLSAGQLVVDIIAQPPETALLRTAKSKGCRVQSGVKMIENHMNIVAQFIAGA